MTYSFYLCTHSARRIWPGRGKWEKKEKEIIEGGWEAASFTTKGAKSICNKPGKQQTWLLGNIYDSRHCVTSLKRAQWEQAF